MPKICMWCSFCCANINISYILVFTTQFLLYMNIDNSRLIQLLYFYLICDLLQIINISSIKVLRNDSSNNNKLIHIQDKHTVKVFSDEEFKELLRVRLMFLTMLIYFITI